ncbi:unnamed protein product, partial [Allacma fusca]
SVHLVPVSNHVISSPLSNSFRFNQWRPKTRNITLLRLVPPAVGRLVVLDLDIPVPGTLAPILTHHAEVVNATVLIDTIIDVGLLRGVHPAVVPLNYNSFNYKWMRYRTHSQFSTHSRSRDSSRRSHSSRFNRGPILNENHITLDNVRVDAEDDVLLVEVETDDDAHVLGLAGSVKESPSVFSEPINSELAKNWNLIATGGVHDSKRVEIESSMSVPSNCTRISPPKLNPELQTGIISEFVNSRDRKFSTWQQLIVTALTEF